MWIDARTVERDSVVDTDVCIVGAGAAGITLARALDGKATKVALLESGGFVSDEQTQGLYRGSNEGTVLAQSLPYLSVTRYRYFGGTTNVWAGWCRPLDPIDFEQRPWIPRSGWPFPRSHLLPWYERACAAVEIQPLGREYGWQRHQPDELLLEGSERVVTNFFHFSPPTRFGEKYRGEIERSQNVSALLGANAVDIQVREDGNAVDRVAVATIDGNRFAVRARQFVLAAGGIENARLLLLSDAVHKSGLGNEHDWVGRCFSDHPHLDAGQMVVSRASQRMKRYHFFEDPQLEHRAVGVLSIAEEVQRAEELLNLRIYLRPLVPRRLPAMQRAVARSVARLDTLAAEAGELPAGEPVEIDEARHFALDVSCECTPNPDSRVTLSDERDALGKRRVHLDWRLTPEDNLSIRRSVEIIGQELGRLTQGRAQLVLHDEDAWPRAYGACHHMGTARMHRDPEQGVVDADCRVHGIENLYVAGSAVFPSFGFSNPTLTIVALALRLADHLAGKA